MGVAEVVWLVVAAVLALTAVYSFYLGVASLFATDGQKLGLKYLGISALLFAAWNGWNWLMGQ